MAYFAKLGTGNIVEQVISINNSVIIDANKIEQEQLGNDFINKLYNTRDVWKQTSYNSKIRKNYAGIGYTYDETLDAFIAPQPFASWKLDEKTAQWKAPVDYPTDDKRYTWDEESTSWKELV
jgi:hypothetical protein